MSMSDEQLLEILRAEEAKLIDGGTTLTGFVVTGEQIALAGMREVERRYHDALVKSRALLRDRCYASSWFNDGRMYEHFKNVLEPLLGRFGD